MRLKQANKKYRQQLITLDRIQFIMQMENGKKLFLDLLVRRTANGILETAAYR